MNFAKISTAFTVAALFAAPYYSAVGDNVGNTVHVTPPGPTTTEQIIAPAPGAQPALQIITEQTKSTDTLLSNLKIYPSF